MLDFRHIGVDVPGELHVSGVMTMIFIGEIFRNGTVRVMTIIFAGETLGTVTSIMQ